MVALRVPFTYRVPVQVPCHVQASFRILSGFAKALHRVFQPPEGEKP